MTTATDNAVSIMGQYIASVRDTLCWSDSIAGAAHEAVGAIEQCRDNGATVYACGNGGSWATAAHFVCDIAKTPQGYAGPPVPAVCLGTNPALLTANANDAYYARIFEAELRWTPPYHCPAPDVLVCISASGNSLNVANACVKANNNQFTTIGLTGFDGGELAKMVDISIHVPSDHYGVVEDCHSIICHAIAYFLAGEKIE